MSKTANAAAAPRVRRLSGALIDQIAAGEVVERPASIVKELVENALDAGATRVRLEVRGGGRDWIAVTDDGCGMTPEDARLALERHATSKLAGQEDLQHIGSYGFRGEALPAIASVSALRLQTRTLDAEEAFEIRVEAGVVQDARAVGGPVGTRVEVARLFEAVPARLKFLKSEATEWGHLSEWLARSGLALPDVHFDMQRDGRRAWSWPAVSDPRDRAAAVLGEREAAALVAIDHEEGRARVTGLLSPPHQHRGTSAGIRLFVNRRSVRDRMLQHALLDAYRDLLPRGRFPTAVVFLELPSAAVDVNVHPAKWEVRFADPRGMHRLMRDAVRSSMAQRSWIASPTTQGAAAAREPGTTDRRGRESSPGPASTAEASDWLFAGETGAGAVRETPVPSAGRVRFGELRLLGQLLATYLLLEAKDQLLLVDQHAAHERVIYERLRAEWLERGVERQALLAPLTVQLEPRSFAALTEQAEEALRLGFEAEAFGAQTVALRTVPALLADRDPAALLRSLADELAEGVGGLAPESLIRSLAPADRSFATLACHSARRKGDILGPEEQHALLDALDAIPWAPTCPHGRPVAVPVELAEIERRFGRR